MKKSFSKHPQITSALRRQIVDGKLRPGHRLPNRVQLERDFGASTVTIQKALDRLSSDGFVSAHRRRGTFVVDRPPHLSRYALAFYTNPNEFYWGRFWETIRLAAGAVERTGDRQVPCFYDLQGHPDSEDFQKLLRELRSERLAGVIYTSPPHLLLNSPLFEDASLPCVAITSGDSNFSFPVVAHDRANFHRKALDYFEQRGRRAVAMLFKSDISNTTERADVLREVKRRKLIHRPYWKQVVDAYDPESASSAMHCLFHPGQDVRPDALLIDDDTFLESAVAGLLAAGVRVPDDVEVVSLCNFPSNVRPVLPVKRLGFDTGQLLQTCMDLIDMQRRGKKPPAITYQPVRFEEEIEGSQKKN